MCKRLLLIVLALGLMSSLVYAAPCGSIMLISDSGYHYYDDFLGDYVDVILDADGKTTAQGGKYVDSTMVDFLVSAGYTVDMSGMGGDYRRKGKNSDFSTTDWWDPTDTTGRKEALENSCLVILSKFADSGSYAQNEAPGMCTTVAWNTLAVPLLSQNAHMLRGNGAAIGGGSTKWGWTNGNNGRNYQGSMAEDMAPVPVCHPAYSWLDPVQLFDWSSNGGYAPDCQPTGKDGREPDLPIGDWVPEATILGYLENDPTVWGVSETGSLDLEALYCSGDLRYMDHAILAYVPAGVDLDAYNSNGNTDPGMDVYGTTGQARGYFGIWSYDGSPLYTWDMDLTDAYKQIFLNVVGDMCCQIPEPATIALLGLGGLALLRKRR